MIAVLVCLKCMILHENWGLVTQMELDLVLIILYMQVHAACLSTYICYFLAY